MDPMGYGGPIYFAHFVGTLLGQFKNYLYKLHPFQPFFFCEKNDVKVLPRNGGTGEVGINWNYPPIQDASHHQEYSIFSRESQTKPSFVTIASWVVDGNRFPWGPL